MGSDTSSDQDIDEQLSDPEVVDTVEIANEIKHIADPVVADNGVDLCSDQSLDPPPPHQLPSFCTKFFCPTDMGCDECIAPILFPKEPSNKMFRRSRVPNTLSVIFTIRANEESSRQDRRAKLKELLAVKMGLNPEDGPITLFTLNGGYSYLFLNWLCSLHHNNIAEDIRKSTIIIATDDVAKDTAERVNFHVVRSEWLEYKIDEAAPWGFSTGPHRLVNAVHMIYISDLIALGYDVLSSDVDTVWIRDVRAYFDGEHDQYDVAMPYDGRDDQTGPGNSGLIHIRSNCATKKLVATLIHYIGAQIRSRTDQTHWNMLLKEFKDRVQFELLPEDVFVNGHSFGMPPGMKYKYDSSKMWFAHASWTANHGDKVKSFKAIDAWYFVESCPFYRQELTES